MVKNMLYIMTMSVSYGLMAFVDGQAKLASIAKLQAQLQSDPTRPLPTEIPSAAPGMGYSHYLCALCLWHILSRPPLLFGCRSWKSCCRKCCGRLVYIYIYTTCVN